MSYTIENYKKDDLEITIGYDDHAEYMYDELWDGVTFISNHRDYADKGNLDHLTIEHILDNDIPEGYEVFPITAYIHGRIALTANADNAYPFNCRFDSGTFGFLLFKTGEFGENNIGLDGFVNYWQAVLNGDVYYFTIEDETEVIESCGGFTDMDDMKEEIDSIVKSMLQSKEQQRVEKLKAMIRNRAPLNRRVG